MNIANTFLILWICARFFTATITEYWCLIHALRLQGGKVKTRNFEKLTR